MGAGRLIARPRSHKVTESQSHRGWGWCDKCDKVRRGEKRDRRDFKRRKRRKRRKGSRYQHLCPSHPFCLFCLFCPFCLFARVIPSVSSVSLPESPFLNPLKPLIALQVSLFFLIFARNIQLCRWGVRYQGCGVVATIDYPDRRNTMVINC